jgi:hypothetical protein
MKVGIVEPCGRRGEHTLICGRGEGCGSKVSGGTANRQIQMKVGKQVTVPSLHGFVRDGGGKPNPVSFHEISVSRKSRRPCYSNTIIDITIMYDQQFVSP